MQITKSDTESLLNHLEGETREERLNSLQIVCDILERFTGIKEYMPGFLSNDFMAKVKLAFRRPLKKGDLVIARRRFLGENNIALYEGAVCEVLEALEGGKLAVRNIHTKMPIEASEDCFKLLGVKEECWAEEEEITAKYAKAFSDWGLMAEIAREKRGG